MEITVEKKSKLSKIKTVIGSWSSIGGRGRERGLFGTDELMRL